MRIGFNKVFLLLGCMAACLLLQAEPAFAQARSASTGTLIAAVMEQVGYHAQAQVLRSLSVQLEWLAALIYLGVLTSMIMTVALMGSYKPALWALVGPALFIYASGLTIGGQKNTINGAGVEWRFGAFDDTRVANDKRAIMSRPQVGTPGEVSFLFHKYNELVSEIMQKIIKVMTNENMRRQMLFMARQRTMEDLFSDRILEAPIKALAAYFMVQCSVEISYARMISLGNRDETFREDDQYKQAKDEYCRLFPMRNKPFDPGPWQDYVYDNRLWEGTNVSVDQHRNYQKRDFGLVSCAEMWGWLRIAARNQALGRMGESAPTNLDPNAWRIYGNRLWNDVMFQLWLKLTSNENVAPERTQSPGDPCPNASGSVTSGGQNGAYFEILANIFGGYLIRQEMQTTPPGEFMTRVQNGHSGFRPGGSNSQIMASAPTRDAAILRRHAAQQFAEARRYEAFIVLTLLPYLQGVLLYVLAVSYPFFAMMLLLPSHASAFFTWMALWAWAKSWDVGWAFVIIADEIMWQLMPKMAYINPQKPAPYSSPISLLEAAYDGDHSYSLATYWLMVSGMITGVPIITAQALLGAKKAIAGVMLKGITDFSDQLSNGGLAYIGGSQARAFTSARETSVAVDLTRASSLAFTQMAHNRDLLEAALGPGVLESLGTNVEATSKLKSAQLDQVGNYFRRFMMSSLLPSSPEAKAAIDKIDEDIKKGNIDIKKAENSLRSIAHRENERQKNQLSGELNTLLNSKLTGPIVQRLMKGERMTKKEIDALRMAHVDSAIIATLGDDAFKGNIGDIAQDKAMAGLLRESTQSAYRRQVLAYDQRHASNWRMLTAMPWAGFGYGAGGAPLAVLLGKSGTDQAAAQQMYGYMSQRYLMQMEMDLQTRTNEWLMYESNMGPGRNHWHQMRAGATLDRVEWFLLRAPPTDAFWQFQHMNRMADQQMAYMQGQSGGAYRRFFLDQAAVFAARKK